MRLPTRPPASRLAIGVLLTLLTAAPVLAAMPDAGTIIGNQATATYTDANGESRIVTSNLVETVVTQVAGVDLAADQSDTVAPGGTVYLSHTIENTGNGADTYELDVDEAAGIFTAIALYADADCNGVADDFDDIDGQSTPSLDSGDSWCVVIAATVAGSAAAGASDTVDLTATSDLDGVTADTNTDTVTVTSRAVIEVTKALDIDRGASPNAGPITVTLTYTNTGNDTATALTLTDSLPSGMSYVANSGRWSGTGATVLTDATDGDEVNSTDGVYDDGLEYSSAAGVVTALVENVAPGQSGFVRFAVSIDAGLAPGDLDNTADVEYDDGSGSTITETTNTATYTVVPAAGVDLSDDGSATDEDGAVDDQVTIETPVAQGATLNFENILENTGNGTDTFDITYSNTSFPAGTTFQIFRADGVTPMTDTNGNGIPDTGPVAAGATYAVVLKVFLPPGANDTTTGGGPYQVIKTATSAVDTGTSDSVTDQLDSITDSTVDVTNDAGGTLGAGAGPEVNPVTTLDIAPGATDSFDLYVANDSSIPDNFDLQFSDTAPFDAGSLPAGWQVVFRDAASQLVITNTGVLAAGATLHVVAEVTVPAGNAPVAAPGQSLYFRALSPTTGAADVKHDAVTVPEVHDLSLAPSNSGQAFPGGTVVYGHVVVNEGNVTEAAGALTVQNSDSQWTSVIYHDANGDGTIDPADPVVDDLADLGGLTPGESIPLLVKVFAPGGAEPGEVNVTSFSVDDANFDGTADATGDGDMSNNRPTDTTTVISGDVTLLKEQALDATCDGTADGSYQTTTLSGAGPVPGACLLYRITVTNTGSVAVADVEINDATPPWTTYGCDDVSPQVANACAASATAGTVSPPALAGSGVVNVDIGDLDPGESVVLTFGVKIDS